ncbi:glycosyltransferase family 4 protein [Arenibaculum pallidiluteum]|uniref:glycosyltransferase family 4 protein n=1 Tax=Arenibaculum pallidiluteum TaxID=2812559 RepID=UPI001A974E9C|nr:glycosyltransferase family 4 protein [Arenibaculum pallidiluteum]
MSKVLTLLHGVWRRLPREPRRRIAAGIPAILAARPSRPAPAPHPGQPVTVAGLLRAANGLGEGARLMMDAMGALGREVRHLDVSAAFRTRDMVDLPLGPEGRPGDDGPLIVHVNAPHMPYALMRLGRRHITGRRVIGYWAWELPEVPPTWRAGLPFVHEVWAPSRFTAEALGRGLGIPVHVVPHPVGYRPPVPAPLDRAAFGLPADALVVLTVFNLASGFTRKNPLGALRAFKTAFGDDPRRILVLKLVNADHAPELYRALRDAIGGAPNVRVLEQRQDAATLAALMACADIVLSLHRAEGFGLVPAEAMLLGKPVVATAWSGNLDFMTPETAALVDFRLVPATDPQGTYELGRTLWADPYTGAAAAWLRRLAEDAGLRTRMGGLAAATLRQRLGLEAYRRVVEPLIG